MRLVIDPAALVLVAMHVPESPLTMRLVVAPITLIPGSVLPNLLTLPMSILALPLPSIPGSILENVLGTILDLAIIVVLAGQQRFAHGGTRRVRLLLSLNLPPLHNGRV